MATKGGDLKMMNWGYSNMMNFGSGTPWFGFFGFLFWLIVLIDLTLLGIWLWKLIQKK